LQLSGKLWGPLLRTWLRNSMESPNR
jgi:hypothetical protein